MVSATNGTNGTGPKGTFLFTSESVGEGHPDKIAYVVRAERKEQRWLIQFNYRDQVSDAILDACLAEDPLSKVSPFVVLPKIEMLNRYTSGCVRNRY